MAKNTKNRSGRKPEDVITLTTFQRRVAEELFDGRMVDVCGGSRAEIQEAIEQMVKMDLFKVFLHLMETCDVVAENDGDDDAPAALAEVIPIEGR